MGKGVVVLFLFLVSLAPAFAFHAGDHSVCSQIIEENPEMGTCTCTNSQPNFFGCLPDNDPEQLTGDPHQDSCIPGASPTCDFNFCAYGANCGVWGQCIVQSGEVCYHPHDPPACACECDPGLRFCESAGACLPDTDGDGTADGCLPAHCTDGVMNGDELNTDCGGSCDACTCTGSTVRACDPACAGTETRTCNTDGTWSAWSGCPEVCCGETSVCNDDVDCCDDLECIDHNSDGTKTCEESGTECPLTPTPETEDRIWTTCDTCGYEQWVCTAGSPNTFQFGSCIEPTDADGDGFFADAGVHGTCPVDCDDSTYSATNTCGCTTPDDCPDDTNLCTYKTCVAGICGQANLPDSTPPIGAGTCQTVTCSGGVEVPHDDNPYCDDGAGNGVCCGWGGFSVCCGDGAPGYFCANDASECTACNNNGAQDNGETGVDCGGGGCPNCLVCNWNSITDNGEAGTDCGGGGCPACSCDFNSATYPSGSSIQCGTDEGVCEFGTQTCSVSGVWGSCTGALGPTEGTELSCDGQDNDCDGTIDESPVCCVDGDGDGYQVEGATCGTCTEWDPIFTTTCIQWTSCLCGTPDCNDNNNALTTNCCATGNNNGVCEATDCTCTAAGQDCAVVAEFNAVCGGCGNNNGACEAGECNCKAPGQDCDATVGNTYPACPEICTVGDNDGVCEAGECSCDQAGQDCDATVTTPAICVDTEICNNDLDDDGNGECNYDGRRASNTALTCGTKGDIACAVDVVMASIDTTNICTSSEVVVSCEVSQRGIHSITATLNGASCSFENWHPTDPVANFRCTGVSPGGLFAQCVIDETISYVDTLGSVSAITNVPVCPTAEICANDVDDDFNGECDYDGVGCQPFFQKGDIACPVDMVAASFVSGDPCTGQVTVSCETSVRNLASVRATYNGVGCSWTHWHATQPIAYFSCNAPGISGAGGYGVQCSIDETMSYVGTTASQTTLGSVFCPVAEICNNDIDDDLNGECDYDGQVGCSPILNKGDSACPVHVTSAFLDDTNTCMTNTATISCGVSADYVGSIRATLTGSACSFESWVHAQLARFTCTGVPEGTLTAECFIDDTVSYVDGPSMTDVKVVSCPCPIDGVCTPGECGCTIPGQDCSNPIVREPICCNADGVCDTFCANDPDCCSDGDNDGTCETGECSCTGVGQDCSVPAEHTAVCCVADGYCEPTCSGTSDPDCTEVCDNGADDNGNGDIDCDDVQCSCACTTNADCGVDGQCNTFTCLNPATTSSSCQENFEPSTTLCTDDGNECTDNHCSGVDASCVTTLLTGTSCTGGTCQSGVCIVCDNDGDGFNRTDVPLYCENGIDCDDTNDQVTGHAENVLPATCSDGWDNDCDGEADYDGSGDVLANYGLTDPLHGDVNCPVDITGGTAADVNTVATCTANTVEVRCTANPLVVRSISAEFDGTNMGDGVLIGSEQVFTISRPADGTYTARCFVDPAKSYQTGPDWTDNSVSVDCFKTVEGTVTDITTTHPIEDATVRIGTISTGPIETTTDQNGYYQFSIVELGNHDFSVTHEYYLDNYKVDEPILSEPTTVNFALSPEQCTGDCTFLGICNYKCLDEGDCSIAGVDPADLDAFKSVCDQATHGEPRFFNATHDAICCTGGIEPNNVRKTPLVIESCTEQLIQHKKLVEYNGKLHQLTIVSYEKCE
ncbi:MAG: carboxypeptidase regulatory-like domain-containing protein [Candidatus Woesearchaeota archaeon]|nr:carboxypeptidase regulatory-like domain-containing protein [Candidatus Woesearchaeota archaeon]